MPLRPAALAALAAAALLGVAAAAAPPPPALTTLACGAGAWPPCPGAAVVHPPPSTAKAAGYVDCVSPSGVLDARCVASAGGTAGAVAALTADGDGGFVGFPPADSASVLAACPDTPLLPEGADTPATDLPPQAVLDAAAAQISACVSALRSDPDALACYYPCDYASWRAFALAPPRGGFAVEGEGAAALAAAAARHAADMAAADTFAHAGSDNSTVASRIADAGFATFPLGENIAAGYGSVRAVSLAWACSAGHRANVLACGFDTAGTGVAVGAGSTYTIYFSQEFGCSRPDYDCTCPHGPLELDPAALPPLPACPDGPVWTPSPAAGGGALIGATPPPTRPPVRAAGVEEEGEAVEGASPAETPPPMSATPTPEPTALFAEGTPAPTETEAVVAAVAVPADAAAAAAAAPPATTRPPPDTLAPPAPRPPRPPCPAAAKPASGCLFAAGPGLLSRRGNGGAADGTSDGGSVLVAWAPACGWAAGEGHGGGNASAPVPPTLAATLTPSPTDAAAASTAGAAATVTPMGPLPGRPGTLLAAVATPPGWSGTVTVAVEGGGGGAALSYGVGGGGGDASSGGRHVGRRPPVEVTGVGLVGGAVTVAAPGA